jgi:hypothetical protein
MDQLAKENQMLLCQVEREAQNKQILLHLEEQIKEHKQEALQARQRLK